MKSLFIITALAAFFPVIAGAAEITLPADTSTLRASELPGYAIAQRKCGICHSADYISFQPPGMNLAQWTAEMAKMQHAYGAPLSEEEIKLLGAYLAVTYGSASANDPAIKGLSGVAPVKATTGAIDVQTLLDFHACLSCHAIDTKVVGPAFSDVAAKYQGDADAEAKVVAAIQQGGVGKWGQVPMPQTTGLSPAEADALAAFVLKQ
jgi:cytochrome c551/c552